MKLSGLSAALIHRPVLASATRRAPLHLLLCAMVLGAGAATVAGQGAPGQVTSFSPAQGATGVSLTPTLTWGASANTTSYDVYFGTSSTPPFVTNTTQTSYSPPTLSPNTTYNWFLISRNSSGMTTSFPWSFTTGAAASGPPGAVTTFSPAQGATGVSLTPTITWGASTNTTSYDVYFGTASSPPFVTNTTQTSYSPPMLSPNTTYNWFLISRNSSGTTASFPWSFTTGAASTHPLFFTGEASVGGGAYYLQFPNGNIFGYYNYQYFTVLYHYDLGFEYFVDANDAKNGAYLYDFASGHWFYTSPSFSFPYLYDFTLQAIVYYYPATNNAGHYTSNPRYFYNFGTGMIITM